MMGKVRFVGVSRLNKNSILFHTISRSMKKSRYFSARI